MQAPPATGAKRSHPALPKPPFKPTITKPANSEEQKINTVYRDRCLKTPQKLREAYEPIRKYTRILRQYGALQNFRKCLADPTELVEAAKWLYSV